MNEPRDGPLIAPSPDVDVTAAENEALALVVAVHEDGLRQVLADLDEVERGGCRLPPEAADLHVAVRVVLAAHAGSCR